ncbi:MAG TPA: TetR/AcrR family transcriptional regulator [Acidimicrobiales bacterium]|nr:TetR/AcrR family transcriptional regulator [Acidimicrobiales bacterium]
MRTDHGEGRAGGRRYQARHDPERRTARRAELLDAAIACIRRVGPDASMEQIAAEARVTKPIVYRFFRDKGDLYQAIAERYVGLVGDGIRAALATTDDPKALLKAGIDAYLGLVEQEPEIYRFLMTRAREYSTAAVAIENFIHQLGGELGGVLGEQLAAAGLDTGGAEVWGHAIVGMVNAASDWWVDRQVLSRRRLVHYLVDLLWGGFDGMTPEEARS